MTVKHDALAALTSNAQSIVIADQQITTPVDANLPSSGLGGCGFAGAFGDRDVHGPGGCGQRAGDGLHGDDYVGGHDDVGGGGDVAGRRQLSGGRAAHTYAEEGTYTVTVTVQHDALAAVTSAGQTIVVADQQLTNLTSSNLPPGLLENTSTGGHLEHRDVCGSGGCGTGRGGGVRGDGELGRRRHGCGDDCGRRRRPLPRRTRRRTPTSKRGRTRST